MINFQVRRRNPVFWCTFLPSVVSVIYTILGLVGVVPSLSEEVVIEVLLCIVSALSTLGVLVDPTTRGVSDSELAMTYEVPKAHGIDRG